MPKVIGKYQIIQTIGDGLTCKVKLAFDQESKEKVAIKIIKPDLEQRIVEGIRNEIQAMNMLDHSNIVKLLYAGQDQYVNTEKNKSKEVFYIVLELAKGGELFDFIAVGGKFSESMARYFFLQMMDGLEYCHRNKITHRDLKPENLLLDKDYNLKIADFGFARDLSGDQGDGLLATRCGTVPYMAPEIFLSKEYSGQSVDLFAAGIILFVMVAQHQPFSSAQETDTFYKCYFKNRSDIFWKTMLGKHGDQKAFSPEFMDLINCMLQVDPIHRPTVYEIISHDWCKGAVPSQQEVIMEFQQRHAQVRDEQDKQKQEKMQQKAKTQQEWAEKYRNEQTVDFFLPSKTLEQYTKIYENDTVFFSTYSPDIIESKLVEILKAQKVKFTQSADKYKVKFTKEGIDEQGNSEDVDAVNMCMRISKVDNELFAIQFQKLAGLQISFLKHFVEYKKYMNLNDAAAQKDEQDETTEQQIMS